MAAPDKPKTKRGYLACLQPRIVYEFQYNPTQVTDSKRIEWDNRTPIASQGNRSGGSAAAPRTARERKLEEGGRAFSAASLKQLKTEQDRTLNFKLTIDGRETRPGEPEVRRKDRNILDDLAVLRTFAYPLQNDMLKLLDDVEKGLVTTRWDKQSKEPPSCVLVLGDTSVEGYITDLKITETAFNANLDPIMAEVEITMIERIDSVSFILDSAKRIRRAFGMRATQQELAGLERSIPEER